MMATLDLAAELLRHRLLAVTDAEQRHTGVVYRLRREWRVLVENRGRAAGKDHRLGVHFAEGFFGLLERHDLAIDLLLPNPARDELGNLGAEIDDQNLVVHGRRVPEHSGIGRLNAVRAGFVRALDFRVKPFGSYPPPIGRGRSPPRVVDRGAQQRNLRYPFAGV